MPGVYDDAEDLLRGSSCLGCGRGGRLLCAACLRTLPLRPEPAWPTPCPPGLVPPYAAGPYAGLVRELLLGHKERGLVALRRPLGLLLAAAVAAAVPADTAVVLVPVPSRRAVVRARGHEPTWEITRAAARHLSALGCPVAARRLLVPRGPVLDQSGLGADARAANLAGSMRCPATALAALRRRVDRARVVVCDDVLTTGATVREAQRALEASGLRPAAIAVVAATRRRHPPAGAPPAPPHGPLLV